MTPPNPKTLRGKIVWFALKNLPGLFFILILLGAALLVGQRVADQKAAHKEELKNATAVENPPTNVVALELRPTILQDKITLPGIVEPWTKLALMSKIGGSIEKIFVQEGDHVKQGQLIARIENEDYRIALESAKAAYALAKADYDRNKTLRKKGISTQANLDEQQSKMRQAKAAQKNAELALSRCRVTAPISGIISQLNSEVGMVVNQMMPQPIAEILQIDRVKAVVAIPEADVSAVRQLKQVGIEIRSLDNARFQAQVHFLAPAPETLAHAYRLELALNNPEEKILPGMFLQANIVKQSKEDIVAVPLYTVISRNDEQFVYAVEDGIAHKRPVETGFTEGWQILIQSGLHHGEKVIIQGHRSIEDGQKVRVVKELTDLSEFMP
ncbi:RND family efflux transporter, MFP subunit [Candidatus Electrothrix communis]|uniref:RND family efflux transporter, MFP subunit n=1 Tax=Candidatus Electrothrix communis TaxID=1859133 RepID=A0A3S3RWI6_9BACT|nr:RND family efflux transporter, MFP subunit [Candidatus Electrothrix communis]